MKMMKAILTALDRYELRPLVRSYGIVEEDDEIVMKPSYSHRCEVNFINGWQITLQGGATKRRSPDGEWEDLGFLTIPQFGTVMEATSKFTT